MHDICSNNRGILVASKVGKTLIAGFRVLGLSIDLAFILSFFFLRMILTEIQSKIYDDKFLAYY